MSEEGNFNSGIAKAPDGTSVTGLPLSATPHPEGALTQRLGGVKSRALKLFQEYDLHNEGVIKTADLAVMFALRHADEDDEVKDILNTMALFDTTGSGTISFREFLKVFSFYDHYRSGYLKGYQQGFVAHQEGINTVPSDLPFHIFLTELVNCDKLQSQLRLHTWANVYRPGIIKTPIHKRQSLSVVEDFLAGTWSGVVTCIVGQPFDTIKVRMQTQGVKRATDVVGAAAHRDLAAKPLGALSILRTTLLEEGIRGLYRGMSSPLASIPLVNAIVFASYEQSKQFVSSQTGSDDVDLNHLAWCGGFSGLMACSVVSPVELVRTRLQVQSTAKPLYKGSVDCVQTILETEGIKGLGRGMFATILRDVPAYVTQFYVYEGVKLYMTPEGSSVKDLSTPKILTAGGLGGMAGWFVTYPMDIVKTRLQVVPEGTYAASKLIPDGGFFSCFRDIYQKQGVRGMFRGVLPCLARAFPVNGSAFLAYESASRFFEKNRLFVQD